MDEPAVAALRQRQSRVRHEVLQYLRRSPWLMVLFACVGCAGIITPGGPSDREIRAMVDRNTRNLQRLQAGMFEEYVSDVMGEPQRREIYTWGTAWYYRTSITKGAGSTPDTDLTPLVFDQRGVLLGWGRDFLAEHIKHSE